MFGLEKKGKQPFEFDLEKELKSDPKRKEKLLDHFATRTKELKSLLREGKAEENFDQCGLLLQGYAALTKVINRIGK
ncbi:MAG: DUF5398 family protein [Chlamydiota bacterium]